MPDIIVKKAITGLTVRQATRNTVVIQTTGRGYTLPVASNVSLGGIIVGDNLTIDGTGRLSAQPGGVTAFNNRTGNVTLTANDVSTVGNVLYFPLNGNITSGNASIAGPVDGFSNSGQNGTLNPRQIYGISKIVSQSTTEYQSAIGMNYQQAAQGSTFMARAFNPLADRGLSQSEIRLSSVSATLVSTNKQANGTLVSSGVFGASANGVTFSYSTTNILTYITVAADGVSFFGVAKGVNNDQPLPSEILTRYAADQLYEKLVRKN